MMGSSNSDTAMIPAPSDARIPSASITMNPIAPYTIDGMPHRMSIAKRVARASRECGRMKTLM